MIGVPGHGKDIVDTINTCDKRYLKEKNMPSWNPEADDCKEIMNAHAMIREKIFSWVVTCKNYWMITLEYTEINHTKIQEARNKTKDGKKNISPLRYGGCTHDRNEEESCGSR